MARYCMHGRRVHACIHSGAFIVLHPKHGALFACGCRSGQKQSYQVREADKWVVVPGCAPVSCAQWSMMQTWRAQSGEGYRLTNTTRHMLWPTHDDTMTSGSSGTQFTSSLFGGDGDSRPPFSQPSVTRAHSFSSSQTPRRAMSIGAASHSQHAWGHDDEDDKKDKGQKNNNSKEGDTSTMSGWDNAFGPF
jgi:hypothetical protein